jgi:hypothetical protein
LARPTPDTRELREVAVHECFQPLRSFVRLAALGQNKRERDLRDDVDFARRRVYLRAQNILEFGGPALPATNVEYPARIAEERRRDTFEQTRVVDLLRPREVAGSMADRERRAASSARWNGSPSRRARSPCSCSADAAVSTSPT